MFPILSLLRRVPDPLHGVLEGLLFLFGEACIIPFIELLKRNSAKKLKFDVIRYDEKTYIALARNKNQ